MKIRETNHAKNIIEHDTFLTAIYCTKSIKYLGCFLTLADIRVTSTVCRDVDSIGDFSGSVINEVSTDPCNFSPGGSSSGTSVNVDSAGKWGNSDVSAEGLASTEGSPGG